MANALRFSVAGRVFELAFATEPLSAAAERVLPEFRRTDAPPDWHLHFDFGDNPEPAEEELRLRVKATHQARWEIQCPGRFSGVLDAAAGCGDCLVARSETAGVAIRNWLRYAAVLDCEQQGGVVLHAASRLFKDQAFAFFGVSGAGKSTLSRAVAHEQLLGDELCFVRGTPAHVFRSPFFGEVAAPPAQANGRLTALLALERSLTFSCAPLPKAQAARRLLATTLHLSTDRDTTRLLVDKILALVESVPVWRFSVPLLSPGELEPLLDTFLHRLAEKSTAA